MTTATLTRADEQRTALRAERDAIERRHYTDMLRIREIRAALDTITEQEDAR